MLIANIKIIRFQKKSKPFKFYNYRPRTKRKPLDFRIANRRYLKAFLVSSITNKNFRPNHLFFKSSIYSFSSRFFKNFSYRIRVPFYSKDKAKYIFSSSRSPKRKRLTYTLLPFFGLNLRSSVIRNKYFYKRRSIHNFFKYNFFNFSSSSYKSDKLFFSSVKFYLHIRQTKNNLFFFLKTNSGKLVFNYTNGQTIYKGSRRTTPTAAELAGKQISKFFFANKVSSVCLVFESPITSIIKSAVRGLSNQLVFSSIIAKNFVSHNGLKLRSTRRV
jgi:ribosomal protein S11